MIHFFRKIRQNLLSENRFSKYLIYAIGEIILVMIGILLALYFNNLNTKKENGIKEEWYLINIVEDLEYQKVILEDMLETNLTSIKIGKSLLKDFHENNSYINIDSLNGKLNDLLHSYRFPNTNNTYTELISSGQFGLITNKTLSVDIVNYYTSCKGNLDDINNGIENIFYPEIFPVLNTFSQIELYEDDIKENEDYLLTIDESFIKHIHIKLEKTSSKIALTNAIKGKILILSDHVYMIKESIELNISLVKSIDKYLGIKPSQVNNRSSYY